MRKKNKEKNQIIEKLEVLSIASEGKCIARFEEKVVFLDGNKVAPGDVVDVQVLKKKKNYIEAKPIHFHQYASNRVEPICQHFGTCGGCKWQHIPYEVQLQYKQQQVIDNLTRLAKIQLPDIQPIIGAKTTELYRNKLEFTFSNRRWKTREELDDNSQTTDDNSSEEELANPNLQAETTDYGLGFHIPGRFDKVLDIEKCHLQAEPSNAIRLAIKEYALAHQLEFFDLRAQTGFLRNLLIRTTSIGDLMVVLIVTPPSPPLSERESTNSPPAKEGLEGVLTFLQAKFPEITSLQYFINPKRNDSFQDLEPILFAGKPYIEEEMEGLRFRIGAKSFYQTNSAQAYELYKVTRQMADLQGDELVYDLYTGTGTIANFVARKARQVIGLEYVTEAIEDAKVNSQINGISNTQFFAGDIKDLLNPSFLAQYGKPDVIITDPPRAGMHEDVTRMILAAEPQTIVYVSCNPATQARDLQILDEKYEVVAVQPVDMFPQTHHVENVVKLVKKV